MLMQSKYKCSLFESMKLAHFENKNKYNELVTKGSFSVSKHAHCAICNKTSNRQYCNRLFMK